MKLTDDEVKVLDKAVGMLRVNAASAMRRKHIDGSAVKHSESLTAEADLLEGIKDRLIKEG